MTWWQQPFFQVALPIIVTFVIATWYQSKRVDDLRDSINRRMDALDKRMDAFEKRMDARFDSVERRLERIEDLISDHGRRISVLEERTSAIRR